MIQSAWLVSMSIPSQTLVNRRLKTSRSYDLIAVYQDNKARWKFKFNNGEVWQQIEPRYLPKLENFPVQVDISEGVFGSYDLRAEDFGKLVKVKRLKQGPNRVIPE